MTIWELFSILFRLCQDVLFDTHDVVLTRFMKGATKKGTTIDALPTTMEMLHSLDAHEAISGLALASFRPFLVENLVEMAGGCFLVSS